MMYSTYGRVVVDFTGPNRHQKRKDRKLGRLKLREMPGTQWSLDRGRHNRNKIAKWRSL